MRTTQAHGRNRGFTLVELLLVMLIVTILVALLLPAIQQSREAVRRTRCKNHLMQLGIAMHNYQSAHGVLPPGCVNDTRPVNTADETAYHMSWVVQLLPPMEQQSLFLKVDFSRSVYHPNNATVRGTQIGTLQCPSDPGSSLKGAFVSNYAGCTGGHDVPIDEDNNGLLFLNSSIHDKQIRDGVSNTILFGVRRSIDVPTVDHGWMSGTAATLRNTGLGRNVPPFTQGNGSRAAGLGFQGTADSAPSDDESDGPVPPQLATGGFSSNHTGGAQFCLADGSVRFLSQNIDVKLFSNLGNRDDGHMMSDF